MEYIYQNKIVHYELEGIGPPIILLHGWGQSIKTFSYLRKKLSSSHTVYSINLPGFGQSEEPFNFYTLQDYKNLLYEFVKDNNIISPVVIGHSFGGRIALKYATEDVNIKKLILISSAGVKPHDKFKSKCKIFIYKLKKKYFKITKNIVRYNLLVENSGSYDYKNASPVMKKTLISVVNTYLDKELKNIKCPTLLIWGKNDTVTPVKDAYKIKRKIKHAKLILIEGAGHFSYLDSKRYVSKLISDYIGG